MAIIEIDNLDKLPSEGKIVVFILIDKKAPCKKFLNYAKQATGILEDGNNPQYALYFLLPWNDVTKNEFRLSSMPTTIIYVDGEEKKRFSGHFWSHFEIASMIVEGFNK